MQPFMRIVDLMSEWLGKGVAWLMLPLTFVTLYEVTARYVFNAPTIWAWDISRMLACLLIIWAGAFVYQLDAHIRVDILAIRLAPRKRAIVDIVTSVLFFLCIGLLVWYGAREAAYGVQIKERFTTLWMPPIYPLRIAIVVGAVVLLLQGVVRLLRSLAIARGGSKQP